MASKRIRLAQHRKSAGYSQERLAERLGVERSTVVRWETAETAPQPWLRPKLAKALGVSRQDLELLLAEVAVVNAERIERAAFMLEHPASVDLITVAGLREQLRMLDDAYDGAPSTALVGPASNIAARVVYLREQARNVRVRKALIEVEAESAAFMSQLVWDASQRRDHVTAAEYLDQAVRAARQAREPLAEACSRPREWCMG